MIIRLLIAAAVLLLLAKVYLQDNVKPESVKPKEQINQVQQELDNINIQADQQRKKALEDMGI